jgi:hypothetical protein
MLPGEGLDEQDRRAGVDRPRHVRLRACDLVHASWRRHRMVDHEHVDVSEPIDRMIDHPPRRVGGREIGFDVIETISETAELPDDRAQLRGARCPWLVSVVRRERMDEDAQTVGRQSPRDREPDPQTPADARHDRNPRFGATIATFLL